MDDLVFAAEQAAKNAKRALALTVITVGIALLVVVIDQGIKKSILAGAQDARATLDEIKLLKGAGNGTTTAGEAGSAADPDVAADRDLVHDAAAGAVLDEAAGTPVRAPAKRKARVPSGPQGDG
jgi:hypothetical protein